MQLSNKVERLDLKYILENFKDEKLWSKKWLIFDYDNIQLYMRLHAIIIHNNSLQLKILCDWWSEEVTLPLSVDHRNIELFTRKIVRACYENLEVYERHMLKKNDEYQKLYELETDLLVLIDSNIEKVYNKKGLKVGWMTSRENQEKFKVNYCYNYLRSNRGTKIQHVYNQLLLHFNTQFSRDTFKLAENTFELNEIKSKEIDKKIREIIEKH